MFLLLEIRLLLFQSNRIKIVKILKLKISKAFIFILKKGKNNKCAKTQLINRLIN